MAAREYVIKTLKKSKAWKGSYGEFQDYAVQLQGIGEPVKISLPQPVIEDPEIGDHLYGTLYEEKGQGGRIYYKLKLEKRPEEDVKTMDIHAQVAVKIAVDIWQNAEYKTPDERTAAYANIAQEALHFARMIDDVRKELIK